MKLYTGTGDQGETRFFGGQRVAKDDPRVSAYGGVDELNAALGVARASGGDAQTADLLRELQAELFLLGAELADPQHRGKSPCITEEHSVRLEQLIDGAQGELPALTQFTLPGGTPAGAALHVARAVCRRAERGVVALARQDEVSPAVLVYLNRLGDLLFVLARQANHRAGVVDDKWVPPAP